MDFDDGPAVPEGGEKKKKKKEDKPVQFIGNYVCSSLPS